MRLKICIALCLTILFSNDRKVLGSHICDLENLDAHSFLTALKSRNADDENASALSFCIEKKLKEAQNLALEFAKCNFEVFQILETNCKYLGTKWGELGSLLQNIKPKCFSNLPNNKFKEFPLDNLKFLKPSIFEWFSETDLKNLIDEFKDVNVLSDEQFKMINKSAMSSSVGLTLKESFLSPIKNQALRFALRSDFFKKFPYEPIGKESSDVLRRKLLSLPKVLKLTALLLGNIVVKDLRDGDISLEGETLGNTASFLSILLKLGVNKYKELQTDKIASLCRQIYYVSCLTNVLGSDLRSMLATYSQLTENLPEGESILFPYGWVTYSAGHVMLLEVTKLENEFVYLKVYNSGSGLQTYHVKKRFDSRFKYLPHVKTKPFHYKRLTETNFFEAVYSLSVPQSDSSEDLSSKDAYGIILSRFEFDYEEEVSDGQFIMAQFSATCAMRSILAFLHSNISSREYYLLKHAISVEIVTLLQDAPGILWVNLFTRFTRYLIRDLVPLNLKNEYVLLSGILRNLEKKKISLDPSKTTRQPSKNLLNFTIPENYFVRWKNWSGANNFEKVDLKFPHIEPYSSNFINANITSVRYLRNLNSFLEKSAEIKSPPNDYLSHLLSKILEIPHELDVTTNPILILDWLQSITLNFLKFVKNRKEKNILMLSVASRIVYVAWNAAKAADNVEFSNSSEKCQNCKMEEHGFRNPFCIDEKSKEWKNIYASPAALKKLEETCSANFSEKGDLFDFLPDSFITLNSSIFKYLFAFDKESSMAEAVNELKSKKYLLVDWNLIKASLLFQKSNLLPRQFVAFRNIFIMLQLIFVNRQEGDQNYLSAFQSVVDKDGEVQFYLNDLPFSNGSKKYIKIEFFAKRFNLVLTKKISEIIEPKITKPLNPNSYFFTLFDYQNVSFPGFVSLASREGFLIEEFEDQLMLHQGFYSPMALKFSRISPLYLPQILEVYDLLLNNLKPFLDSAVPIIHAENSGKSSYFEQFAFLMLGKINLAHKFADSINSKEVIKVVRDQIGLELKNLGTEYANAKYYLYTILLYSYADCSTDDERNVLEVLYLQYSRRNLGISVNLPFNLETFADDVYFRYFDKLLSFLSKEEFSLEASKKVFSIDQVTRAGVVDGKLFSLSGRNIYSLILLSMESNLNGISTLPPIRLLKDYNFVKVFGNKLPEFSSQYLSKSGKIYIVPSNQGKFFILEDEGNIYFHSSKNEKYWLISEEFYKKTTFNTAWINSRTLWLNLDPEKQEVRICENHGFQNCIGSFNFKSEFTFVGDSSTYTLQQSSDTHLFPSSLDLKYSMFVNNLGNMRVEFERLYDSMGLPLQFSSVGDRTFWSSNPDFFISNIDIKLPLEFCGYSVLVDDSLNRSRLILPIKTRSDLLHPEKNRSSKMKFEYITIPVENKVLAETNVKNLFYLAYLHMIYHEYDAAWEFLLKVAQIDPFTDEDLKFATWIFTYHVVEKEHFPEIYAIEAYVSWIVFDNYQTFPKDSRKNRLSSSDINSLYDHVSVFRAFWGNECNFGLSKMKMSELSFQIVLRYYQVAQMLFPKMVFTPHLESSTALLTEFMEYLWLKSISLREVQPRLLMIINCPSTLVQPKFQIFSVDVETLETNLDTIKSAYNGPDFSSVKSFYSSFYLAEKSAYFLRPDYSQFPKYFKSFFILLQDEAADPYNRNHLYLYLRDTLNVKDPKLRSLVHFLLLVHEGKNDKSVSCQRAMVGLQEYFAKKKNENEFNQVLTNVISSCEITLLDLKLLMGIQSRDENAESFELSPDLYVSEDIKLVLDFELGFKDDLKLTNCESRDEVKLVLDFELGFEDDLKLTNCESPDEVKQQLEKSYHEIMEQFENLILGGSQDYKIMNDGLSWIKPTPVDLVRAFVHQSVNSYLKHLPKSSVENIQLVHQLVMRYFVNQTALARFNNLLKGGSLLDTSSINEAMKRPYYDKDKTWAVHEYNAIIPALLVFEYQSGGTIRKEHIPDLFRLGTGNFENIVLQRMMSSGKTFVLSTLLSILRSVNNNLSILIVPQALLSTNARDIISRNLRFFNIRGKVFRFGRSPKFINEDNLERIFHQFQSTVISREYIITTIEDIQALRNSFLEALVNYGDAQGNKYLIILLQEILLFLKEKGTALIDEVDWVLNPMTKLRFPISQPQKLDQRSMRVIGELFTRLSSENELSGLQISSSNALTISSTLYEKFKPRIIENAVKVLSEVPSIACSADLIREIFTNSDKNQLMTLLSKVPISERELLLTIHAFIQVHLPETLGKQVNEHYGLSIKFFEKCRFAKPYMAANTPASDEKSDFSELIVVATKTFRTYFQLKLKPNQIREMIESLRDEAFLEKNRKSLLDLEKTQTVLDFDRCFEFKSLFKIKLTDIKELNEIISRINKECAFKYMVNYLLDSTISKLEQFPYQVSSSASNVTSLLKSFDGYSGTIDNPHLFTKVDKNDEVYQKITAKLLNYPSIHFFKGLGLLPDEVLNQLSQILNHDTMKHVKALLDIGAYFRKYSNKLIAKSILSWNPLIKAILFYDESSNDLYYMKANGEEKKSPGSTIEVIESATGFNRDEIFVFLDQRHCTGTDIKMSPNAIGLATASDSVMSREWFQGVMRMRDLVLGNHKVVVICPSELKAKIKESLSLNNEEFGVTELLKLAENNSNKYRRLQNNAAYAQKLEDFVQSSVMDKLLKMDLENLKFNFATFYDLFVSYTPVMQTEKMNETKIVYDEEFLKSSKNIAKLKVLFNDDEIKVLFHYAGSLKLKLGSYLSCSSVSAAGEELHEQLQQEEQEEEEQDQELTNFSYYVSPGASDIYWPNDLSIIEKNLSEIASCKFYETLPVDHTLTVWSLQDALNHIPGISKFSQCFDSRIGVTRNYASVRLNQISFFETKDRPFPFEFLIIKRKNSGATSFRVILLSPFDIEELHVKVEENFHDHYIWLLDLKLNVTFFKGSSHFPFNNKELQKILVQIIVLSGHLDMLSRPDIAEIAIDWAKEDLITIPTLLDLLVLDSQKMAYESGKFKQLLRNELDFACISLIQKDDKINLIKGLCYFCLKSIQNARYFLEQISALTERLEAVAAMFSLAKSPKLVHEFVSSTIESLAKQENNELTTSAFLDYLDQYVATLFSDDLFVYLLDFAESLRVSSENNLLKLLNVFINRLKLGLVSTRFEDLVVLQFYAVLIKLAGLGSYSPSMLKTRDKRFLFPKSQLPSFPSDLFKKIVNLKKQITENGGIKFAEESRNIFQNANSSPEFQQFINDLYS